MFFILFGWGKQTKKFYDKMKFEDCIHCHNGKITLAKVTKWVTFFFIPMIPYSSKHYKLCPNCDYGFELNDDEANRLLSWDKGVD